MLTRIVLVAAIAAALANYPALAEEWISLSKTSDSHPTEIFLDMGNISIKGNTRVAQTRYVPLLPWPDNAQPFDGAAFSIQRVSFNCKTAYTKIGSIELHYSDGRLGFIDVVPSWRLADDEFIKKMLELVCSGKKVRAKTP